MYASYFSFPQVSLPSGPYLTFEDNQQGSVAFLQGSLRTSVLFISLSLSDQSMYRITWYLPQGWMKCTADKSPNLTGPAQLSDFTWGQCFLNNGLGLGSGWWNMKSYWRKRTGIFQKMSFEFGVMSWEHWVLLTPHTSSTDTHTHVRKRKLFSRSMALELIIIYWNAEYSLQALKKSFPNLGVF